MIIINLRLLKIEKGKNNPAVPRLIAYNDNMKELTNMTK
jgi:hypothetical protein